MRITEHARQNFRVYGKVIGAQVALRFAQKVNGTQVDSQDTAIVMSLPVKVRNPQREDWAPNDVICAIVRNGELKTVMLTRTSQINKSHLRVARIV